MTPNQAYEHYSLKKGHAVCYRCGIVSQHSQYPFAYCRECGEQMQSQVAAAKAKAKDEQVRVDKQVHASRRRLRVWEKRVAAAKAKAEAKAKDEQVRAAEPLPELDVARFRKMRENG